MYQYPMQSTVDFHTHILTSYVLTRILHKLETFQAGSAGLEKMRQARKHARKWAKPLIGSVHQLRTLIRFLPNTQRHQLETLFGLLPWPGLLIESSADDLLEAMDQAGVYFALIMAHPLYVTNEEVIKAAKKERRFIPVITLGEESPNPGKTLAKFAQQGARALKIFPPLDASVLKSKKYHLLLTAAADLGMPVMIHTGCFRQYPIYDAGIHGRAEFFKAWYENYSSLKFILVHSNFSNPDAAFDLCENFSNLLVETSWQPSEVIGEAVRRLGAERVLFGSDWPWLGDNLAVGRKSVEECGRMGLLNKDQIQLILGENAIKLLGIKGDAAAI
jgi:uncharacterized protein